MKQNGHRRGETGFSSALVEALAGIGYLREEASRLAPAELEAEREHTLGKLRAAWRELHAVFHPLQTGDNQKLLPELSDNEIDALLDED